MRERAGLNDTELEIHKEWRWFFALGLALAALGAAVVAAGSTAAAASIVALGAVLFVGGLFQLGLAVRARSSGTVALYLLAGLTELVCGFVLMRNAGAGAPVLTMVLAAYCTFSGVYRIAFSVWVQFPGYGWYVFSGAVALATGAMLFLQWPSASPRLLDYAVGANFIALGAAWCAFALKFKQL